MGIKGEVINGQLSQKQEQKALKLKKAMEDVGTVDKSEEKPGICTNRYREEETQKKKPKTSSHGGTENVN